MALQSLVRLLLSTSLRSSWMLLCFHGAQISGHQRHDRTDAGQQETRTKPPVPWNRREHQSEVYFGSVTPCEK